MIEKVDITPATEAPVGPPAPAPAERIPALPTQRRSSTVLWGILLLTIAAVYGPILKELGKDWISDPNYSHGMLAPLISLFLVWRQRKWLAGLSHRPALVGLVGILGSVALLVVGTAGAEVFTQRVSFIAFMASTTVFLLGWRWLRATAFPLGFLLFAIPLPYVLYYSLTGPMQAFAADCAALGLKAAGVPVVAQGNILLLPGDLMLNVEEACSGIRSLFSFVSLGALVAYFTPMPFYARVLVCLATMPLSVAGNAFRVWATSLLAYFFGPSVTKGTVHELFGLFVFAVGLIVFLLVCKGAKRLWPSAS